MQQWRQDFFAKHITKRGLGIEIGPSHAPIAAKKDGYNVKVVDHADYKGLVQKYKALGIDTSQIEEVDYVWDGKKSLTELTKKPRAFDYAIASHVIEHTTDMLQFLQDCEKLLKPSGRLCLAIPDKRYCFDYFRFPTNTGEVLEAYEHKNTRHTPGKLLDARLNAVSRGNKQAWSSTDTGKFELQETVDSVQKLYKRAQTSKEYIDAHNWLFTPNSFKLLIADLQALGYTKLSYVDELPTQGFEFFVILSAKAPKISTPRIDLLNGMMNDIKAMLEIDEGNLSQKKQQLEKENRILKRELKAIRSSRRWRYTSVPSKVVSITRRKR